MNAFNATIIGHMTHDPDIRNTKDGKRVASVPVAVNYSKELVVFTKVTVFENNEYYKYVIDDLAEAKKGDLFMGTGLQYFVDDWVDQAGNEKQTHHFKPGFGAQIGVQKKVRTEAKTEERNDVPDDEYVNYPDDLDDAPF